MGVRGVSWEEGDWATRSILDTRSVVEEYDITPVSAVKKDSHDHNSRCAISKYNVPRIHDETHLTLGWFGALTPSDKQFSGQSVSLIAISNLWQPSGSILLALSGNLALPAWRIRTHIHQGCRHRWRRLGDRARAYGGLMFRVPSSAGFVWRDPHKLAVFRNGIPRIDSGSPLDKIWPSSRKVQGYTFVHRFTELPAQHTRNLPSRCSKS